MPPAPALISRFYTETISSSDELDRQYKSEDEEIRRLLYHAIVMPVNTETGRRTEFLRR